MQKDKAFLILRNKILLLVLSFCSITSTSQVKDSLIIWNKNYKLSWDDFLGDNLKIQNSEDIAAISSLEIINVITPANAINPLITVIKIIQVSVESAILD